MSADRPQFATAGIYRGPTTEHTHNRNIDRCQRQWREHGLPYRYDDLILEQLRLASAQGRTEVNHVDIGSGDAGIFNEFLTDPGSMRKTAKFLNTHPDLTIRLTGITDAPSTEAAYTSKHLPSSRSSQLTGENCFFSLTAAQRLSMFLTGQNLNGAVDLFTATSSLQYLGPNNFRHVVEDIIANLRGSGSVMLGSAYSSLFPGMIFRGSDITLDIPESNSADIPSLLRDRRKRFTTGAKTRRSIGTFIRTMEVFKSQGIQIRPDLDTQELQTIQDSGKPFDFRSVAAKMNLALEDAEAKLLGHRAIYFRSAKWTVLDELTEKYCSQIALTYTRSEGGGIYIRKLT